MQKHAARPQREASRAGATKAEQNDAGAQPPAKARGHASLLERATDITRLRPATPNERDRRRLRPLPDPAARRRPRGPVSHDGALRAARRHRRASAAGCAVSSSHHRRTASQHAQPPCAWGRSDARASLQRGPEGGRRPPALSLAQGKSSRRARRRRGLRCGERRAGMDTLSCLHLSEIKMPACCAAITAPPTTMLVKPREAHTPRRTTTPQAARPATSGLGARVSRGAAWQRI